MDRRTAIRTLATATALPVLAPSDAAALLEARRLVAGVGAVPAALSANELEIVGRVADIILPRTETPGASDVGVPAFVDLIVAEWMDDDQAEVIHDGLASLDRTAEARFGQGFASSSAEEQEMLVRELDDRLPPPDSGDDAPDGFYPTLKRLVITGYFTTETGAAQTGYRLTPGAFAGCVVPEASR